MIMLSKGTTTAANDAGILIERGSTGDNAFMGWDHSASRFIMGTTTADSNATGDLTISKGSLEADLVGNAATASKIDSITNSDIVQLTATQTLTNKTLTSPTISASGLLTIGDGTNVVLNTNVGTKFGTGTDQKLGFYDATPIAQRADGAQAAVGSQGLGDTAAETYTRDDMSKIQTELNDVTALANEMRTVLVNLGLMKGSA